MSLPDFEVFKNKNGRANMPTDPTLTISCAGHFTLNRPAFEALGEPEAVELLYAREQQIIGIRAVDPDSPNAYRTQSTNQARSFVVSGRAFMRYYEITLDAAVSAMRWPAAMVEEVLCVDLSQPGIQVTKGRSKSSRFNAPA
jgi:hypothetical protein